MQTYNICKFLFTIWVLWKERNDCILNNGNFNALQVFFKASIAHKEWQLRIEIDLHQLKSTPFTSHTQQLTTLLLFLFDGTLLH